MSFYHFSVCPVKVLSCELLSLYDVSVSLDSLGSGYVYKILFSMYAQQKDIEALFSKIKDSAKEALDTVKSIADHDAIKHNLNSKVCSLHYRESLDSVT